MNTVQEVSFQYFRNELLARGLVDKLEVLNKNTARVYVRTSGAGAGAGAGMAGQADGGMQSSGTAAPGQSPSQYKYYFNIGSIDSFERKMEEAQQSFGLGLGEEVGLSALTLPGSILWVLATHFVMSDVCAYAVAMHLLQVWFGSKISPQARVFLQMSLTFASASAGWDHQTVLAGAGAHHVRDRDELGQRAHEAGADHPADCRLCLVHTQSYGRPRRHGWPGRLARRHGRHLQRWQGAGMQLAVGSYDASICPSGSAAFDRRRPGTD